MTKSEHRQIIQNFLNMVCFDTQGKGGDCSKSKQQTYLGLFDKLEDAFMVYRDFKESVIKQKAVEYKEVISRLVYEVLFDYKVGWRD